LLADYLSKASKPAAPKKIPIRSVWVENFTNNHGVFNADAIKLKYFGERAEIGLKWNLKEKTEHVWLRVEMPEQKTRQ
jgi:hypothetical protein